MFQSEARNPRILNAIAYALWSFPFTYILLMGSFYNLPLTRMFSMFFSFPYIAHSLLAVFTGFALFRMRPYAWHFFVLHAFAMYFEQFYVAFRYAENNIVEVPLIFVCIGITATLWILKSELRVPYFSPKIAWWESDPRYKISVPVEMTCSDHFYKGEIMDISASGCFIKTKDPLKVDQSIQIKFSLFDQAFNCNGRVVWRTESGVTHPKGVGVKFGVLDKAAQLELRQTVKKLKSLSSKFKTIRAEEKISSMERKVEALSSQRKG